MPRSLTVRAPTRREVRQLEHLLTTELAWRPHRRAEAILLHAAGLPATTIARALSAHPNTIYGDLHAFEREGLPCLTGFRVGGAPARLTREERATILRVAQQPPGELGLPEGRWSLTTLRAYLLRHRVVRSISREHLRRVLKKGATASGASSASSRAPTQSGRRS